MKDSFQNILKEKFRDVLDSDAHSLNGYMHGIRESAFNNFTALGFPTRKNEDWKYTSVNFINNIDFIPATEPTSPAFSADDINRFLYEDIYENIIVLYNGFYNKGLTRLDGKTGIVVTSLRDAFETHSDIIRKHFNSLARNESEAFTALNTALAADGAFIYIPDGTVLEKPVQLLLLTDTKLGDILASPRNLVVAGSNARASIIQTCFTFGDNFGLTNLVTEIAVGQDSILDFHKMHNCRGNSYFIGTAEVAQESNSVFNNVSVSINGMFHRNQVNTSHNGERCETNYYGLYFLNGSDFIDNRTSIDHAKPNCMSNELYKGIIDGKGQAVFNGKILVRQDAQKTQAYQSNKNILLSGDATINTKPQLEIFADDVKCSHGATSGSLDKEEIFYLASRGIGLEKARALLLSAFAGEVIEKISIPQLRNEIKKQIAGRLATDDIYFCEVLENHEFNLE